MAPRRTAETTAAATTPPRAPLRAERHPRQFRRESARHAEIERSDGGATAALWPHRRRPADRGAAGFRQQASRSRPPCLAAENTTRCRSPRFYGRGGDPGRRHGHHPPAATPPRTARIVVALVDENEVTLKRLRRRGNSIALEAGQPALRDADLRARPGTGAGPADRGLLRKYLSGGMASPQVMCRCHIAAGSPYRPILYPTGHGGPRWLRDQRRGMPAETARPAD